MEIGNMNKSILSATKGKYKKIFMGAGILLATLSSFSLSATEYIITGQIHILSTTDQQISGTGEAGSTLRLAVATPQSAGSCFVGSSGHLVIHIRDNAMGERMFTTLLAAQLSSKSVTATVNDSYRTSDPDRKECYLQRVRIEN